MILIIIKDIHRNDYVIKLSCAGDVDCNSSEKMSYV